MAETKRRKTRQLEVIWEAIKDETSHPTADQIYEKVRKEIPNISLGTVYRNLQKLVAEQRLQVLKLSRSQHFDPLVDRHDHFICESCGRVYDIFIAPKDVIPPSLPAEGFKITSHQLSLYGTCEECARNPRASNLRARPSRLPPPTRHR
ncbi:MAG TPA: transcriptional repressor [Candidatus Acidoferrales bacterium]|nr:transcriptional repressor [Candidatus Acidoferrales bacterium]